MKKPVLFSVIGLMFACQEYEIKETKINRKQEKVVQIFDEAIHASLSCSRYRFESK